MPANLSGWLSHGKVLEDHTKKQEKVLPEVIVACLDTSNPYMMITELTMTNILQKYKERIHLKCMLTRGNIIKIYTLTFL